MKIPNIVIVLLLLIPSFAYGQYSESIQSSRPGQAFIPYTTGKSIFQFQTGINMQWTDFDLGDEQSFAYALQLRYGISERVEIRLSGAYLNTEFGIDGEEDIQLSGIQSMQAGFRFNLINNENSVFAIQPEANFYVGGGDFSSDNPTALIKLIHQLGFGQGLSITSNLGAEIGDEATGSYVLNFGFPIGEKFGAFVETYGNFGDGEFTILFDTGLAYVINPDLQLDFSLGASENDGIQSFFVDLGLSWRTGRSE